jgi:DNA adenine methylase
MTVDAVIIPRTLKRQARHVAVNTRVQSPIKWAGGKSRLLTEILPLILPYANKRGRYFEPFVGGGAVFFSVFDRFAACFLNDANPDIANAYRMVRDHLPALLTALNAYEKNKCDENAYYTMRAHFNKLRKSTALLTIKNSVERAALFVYFNKTAFNGLWRVNKADDFNVPFGKYENPNICDEPVLRRASGALKNAVDINDMDFATSYVLAARKGDVIYFDPPYMPASASANFTAYTKNGFNLQDHERLFRVMRDAIARGARCVLSEGDTPEIRALAENKPGQPTLTVLPIQANRAINSDGAKRGPVPELLIYGGGD